MTASTRALSEASNSSIQTVTKVSEKESISDVSISELLEETTQLENVYDFVANLLLAYFPSRTGQGPKSNLIGNLGEFKALDGKIISKLYKDTVTIQRKSYLEKHGPHNVTEAERDFHQFFDHLTKKRYEKSFLIGRYWVDVFVPWVSGDESKLKEGPLSFIQSEKTTGMIIEIDGSIHDRERKMATDNFRERLFGLLNIPVVRVLNGEVSSQALKLAQGIRKQKPMATRQNRKLMAKIELVTVLLNNPELCEFITGHSYKTLAKRFLRRNSRSYFC